MSTITLSAGADLVQRLAVESDPVRAVIELVWNGLDADADHVAVSFERNEADGIIAVIIRDDGNGMSPERIDQDFRWVGNSWKRAARTSENKKRPMHGRFGQGRLRAFALGTHVKWTTVALDTEQKFKRSVVSSSVDHYTDFTVSTAQDAEGPSFTEFTAEGRDGLSKLDSDDAKLRLGVALAPHLIKYPAIEILYDGRKIDSSDNIEHDQALDLEWAHGEQTYQAKLRVIEWSNIKGRSLLLCDADGVPVDDGPTPKGADFNYAAYVMWDQMPEHENRVQLVHMEQEPSSSASSWKPSNENSPATSRHAVPSVAASWSSRGRPTRATRSRAKPRPRRNVSSARPSTWSPRQRAATSPRTRTKSD